MARRKRSTNRRTAKTKGRRSSQAKKEARLVNNLVGLIVSLLMLLGLTNLGSLGTFIANCFRILVGESYPLAIITVMIFSLSYTFYAQAPRLKLRWVAGYLVTYTGLLLWLHVLMVSQQNVHANFIPVTWSNLMASLNNRVFRTLGSPIIFGADTKLMLRLRDVNDHVMTCDREQLRLKNEKGKRHLMEVSFQVSQKRISFARYRHTNFWNRVKDSFIGGGK